MQYMLLIYTDPAREPRYGTPEFARLIEGYNALTERMRADGVMRGGDGLHGPETATSVRVKDGRVETMDGPFATTKEYFGGYYAIDVPDLDAALRYAAMIPSAAWGTVEVRAVRTFN